MQSTFTVKGMSCEHCKATIEGAVKALGGVTTAEANLETKIVSVDHEAGVADARIREAIENAGYAVG
jgi:copper ion binding protein